MQLRRHEDPILALFTDVGVDGLAATWTMEMSDTTSSAIEHDAKDAVVALKTDIDVFLVRRAVQPDKPQVLPNVCCPIPKSSGSEPLSTGRSGSHQHKELSAKY